MKSIGLKATFRYRPEERHRRPNPNSQNDPWHIENSQEPESYNSSSGPFGNLENPSGLKRLRVDE